jgi:hypothetical protein
MARARIDPPADTAKRLMAVLRFERFIVPYTPRFLFMAAIGGTVHGAGWRFAQKVWPGPVWARPHADFSENGYSTGM